ncbi:MAG: hypothetical protein V1820_05380 [archaeon]
MGNGSGKGAIAVFEKGLLVALKYEDAVEFGRAPYAVVMEMETCKTETAGGYAPGAGENKALVYFGKADLDADGLGWLAEYMEKTWKAEPVMDFLLVDDGKSIQAFGRANPELVEEGYLPGVF